MADNGRLRFEPTKLFYAALVALCLSSPAAVEAQGVHGIGFQKGCASPTFVGDPLRCAFGVSNNQDTGNNAGSIDTLTITSIVDTVCTTTPPPACTGATSGNILPMLTLTLSGGATCNVGQTLCTLPPGAMILSDVVTGFSHYTVDADDPNPLPDVADRKSVV